VEFEWDAAKNHSNLAKHGMAFEDVVAVFSDPVQLREPNRLAGEETRLQVIGKVISTGPIFFVVYTLRSTMTGEVSIRVISARRASRRERERYERH
jgi:uncharacterized DUF497 family protein